MHPKRHPSNRKIPCVWCSAGLRVTSPRMRPEGFCSRRCEIEANFWLFQELCAIEITHPPGWGEESRNG